MKSTILAVVAALVLVVSAAAEAQTMAKGCVLLTVYQGDTKQQLKEIGDQVDALLIGVNPLPPDPPEPQQFEHYELDPVRALGITESLVMTVWIASDPTTVPVNVRVELTRQNAAYRQVSFDAGTPSREWMLQTIRSFAIQDGCRYLLTVQPGQQLPLDVTSLFVVLPPPPPPFPFSIGG